MLLRLIYLRSIDADAMCLVDIKLLISINNFLYPYAGGGLLDQYKMMQKKLRN